MKRRDFDIRHQWQLRCAPEELSEIILDTNCYAQWCARILLNCEIVETGDKQGRGLSIRVHTKGWLPYSFLFDVKIVDLEPHRWMKVQVSGDFEGSCLLEVTGFDGVNTRLNLHWQVDLHHPILRKLRPLLHPVMVANHRWAVGWIRRMMQRELDRRRAGIDMISAPKPTFGGFLGFQAARHQARAAGRGWQKALKQRHTD